VTRIPLIEPDDASAEVRDVYERLGGRRMNVLNVMKVFAHDPPFLEGFARMIEALYGDGVISPRHRELAWLRTSQVNDCHY
jgi:alkylhydroperoxidase family enzyme